MFVDNKQIQGTLYWTSSKGLWGILKEQLSWKLCKKIKHFELLVYSHYGRDVDEKLSL